MRSAKASGDRRPREPYGDSHTKGWKVKKQSVSFHRPSPASISAQSWPKSALLGCPGSQFV